MTATLDFETLHQLAQSGDPEAQFQLGRLHVSREAWSRARRSFREAAGHGHAGALNELGMLLLFGIGLPPEPREALALLHQAEAAGAGQAPYQLALMGWCDSYVRLDMAQMAARVREAALRDFAPALRACALLFARMDGVAATVSDDCLARAATLGDAVSQYLWALRLRARGATDASNAWAAQAAARGLPRAAALLGDATPAAPAAQAAPLAQLPPLTLTCPAPASVSRHSDSPLIETFEDLLGGEECEFIIALGEPYLRRSVTIPGNQQVLVQHEHRTSSNHSFYSFQEDFALRWLQWRVLAQIDAPMANAEHLDLLRYLPGQEYRPHRDYLPPGMSGNSALPEQPGQRVHTLFIYLASVAAGGETDFPLLGLRVSPRVGRAVHFHNLLPDGQPDARTLHAGMPVIEGVKWLATLWTRQRRYREF